MRLRTAVVAVSCAVTACATPVSVLPARVSGEPCMAAYPEWSRRVDPLFEASDLRGDPSRPCFWR